MAAAVVFRGAGLANMGLCASLLPGLLCSLGICSPGGICFNCCRGLLTPGASNLGSGREIVSLFDPPTKVDKDVLGPQDAGEIAEGILR